MTRHWVVVTRDAAYLARLAAIQPVTNRDRADCWDARIECEDPGECEGWEECLEPHPCDIPAHHDADGTAWCDDEEEHLFHGVWHTLHLGSWVTPYDGCVVQAQDHDYTYLGVDLSQDGRYEVSVEWDGIDCYLTLADQQLLTERKMSNE